MKSQNNLSLKQQLQALTQKRARAKRNGQPTPKLDAKIEKLKGEMQGTLKLAPASTPSESQFTNYKKVSKSPMQGGSFTPK